MQPISSLITSVPVKISLQSNIEVTLNGTKVQGWADQSGNGNHFGQLTGSQQPTYNAAGLNGQPTFTFTNANNTELVCTTINMPAPGTTASWHMWVAKMTTWAASRVIFGANAVANTMSVRQNTATPEVDQINSSLVNANTNHVLGAWKCGEVYFSNSASDYLRIGATTVSGGNAGNGSTGTGRRIGRSVGGNATDMDFCFHITTFGKPSAGEISAVRAAITALYGASVEV